MLDLGGAHLLHLSLHEVVKDALMTPFFLLVSLEIEREMVFGVLRDPRAAALPIVAAVGGMLAPAAIHLAFDAGRPVEWLFDPVVLGVALGLVLGTTVGIFAAAWLTVRAGGPLPDGDGSGTPARCVDDRWGRPHGGDLRGQPGLHRRPGGGPGEAERRADLSSGTSRSMPPRSRASVGSVDGSSTGHVLRATIRSCPGRGCGRPRGTVPSLLEAADACG